MGDNNDNGIPTWMILLFVGGGVLAFYMWRKEVSIGTNLVNTASSTGGKVLGAGLLLNAFAF